MYIVIHLVDNLVEIFYIFRFFLHIFLFMQARKNADKNSFHLCTKRLFLSTLLSTEKIAVFHTLKKRGTPFVFRDFL